MKIDLEGLTKDLAWIGGGALIILFLIGMHKYARANNFQPNQLEKPPIKYSQQVPLQAIDEYRGCYYF